MSALVDYKKKLNTWSDGLARIGDYELPEDHKPLKIGLPTMEAHEYIQEKSEHLIVLAATTGAGKSILLTQIANNVAATGKKVVLVTPEMDGREVKQRLLQTRLATDKHGLRKIDKKIKQETLDDIGKLELYIEDKTGPNINEIINRIVTSHRAKPIDLIIVDYIQIITAKGITRKAEEVDYIVRQLKWLARELKCPVIAAAQLNRALQNRVADGGKGAVPKPVTSDVADSSAIEKWADCLLFIHRPWNVDKENDPHICQIIGAKFRHGPVKDFDLRFEGERTRFVDLNLKRDEDII